MKRIFPVLLLALFCASVQAQILPGILGGSRQSTNTDPYFSSTKLLLFNDNAANGTGTFADASAAAVTVTKVGSPTYSNAQAPTGMTTTALLSGSGQYFTVASSATYAFGTGDFTLEAYVYVVATVSQLFDSNGGGNSLTMYIAGDAASPPRKVILPSGGTSSGLSYNTWTHIAYSKCSGTGYGYIGGTSYSSASDSKTYGTAILSIGASSGASNAWNGYIASVRITAVGRYCGGTPFTPPTLPLPTS